MEILIHFRYYASGYIKQIILKLAAITIMSFYMSKLETSVINREIKQSVFCEVRFY